MSTPPPQPAQRSSNDTKKNLPPPSSIVTRNGTRNAKIQTRAMAAAAKPSAAVIAAKKKAKMKKKQDCDTILRDHCQMAMESMSKLKGGTGLVTDPRMTEHRCLWDDDYPECPERLTGVIERCKELKLIEQCKQYEARPATKEELFTLHSPTVYEMLETTHGNQDLDYLEELSAKYDAIYFHPSTHELALLAAGSTIVMVDRIISGEVQNGAALIRPPGHHAMRAEPCGYCFYNNVALAATKALQRGLSRILIVDWDVHHGQATQQMFYDDPRVLYFSIHRYEHGAFWPNLRQSNFNYTGCGRGRGFNFNVPLNKTGMKDADYLAIWHQLLLPVALEYQPELVIVSAGYDAAIGCPEGEMKVTPACYAHLTHMLMGVCPCVCVVLEGGYCVPSLAEGAALTLRTLLGHAPPRLVDTNEPMKEPSDSIRESILNCIYAHKPYWNCFNYQPTYSTDGVPNVCDGGKQKHTVEVRWEGDETRPDWFETTNCYPVQDKEVKRMNLEKLDYLRMVTDLTIPPHDVCYIYDEAMLLHSNICEPGHVESPERISRIHEQHLDFGLLDRVHHLEARRATDEEILAVHTASHLAMLKDLAKTKLRDLKNQNGKFDSVYFHPDTFKSAATAAGCVLQTIDAVLNNEARSGVCVIRPPGHHADWETPSGFCLVNNVVVGAKYAIQCHGLKRVMIIDWDVHHGNGTQRLTYDNKKILYISIHRYDNGTFFPSSPDANYDKVGEGRAKGYNVNVPWNKRGMGDVEYMAAFTQVVLPIAYEFDPELVLVSAGFDACEGDPLGGCKVLPQCYGRMTHYLKGLAGGRVILCLEGGYNINNLRFSMTMCTKALLGDPIVHHYEPKTICHWSAIESINNVIKTHKEYWKNLKFQVALPSEFTLGEPEPSRGLVTTEKDSSTVEKVESLTTVLYSSSKFQDTSQKLKGIEGQLADLTIDKKTDLSMKKNSSVSDKLASGDKENLDVNKKVCSDGIHCGTDDEDDDKPKKKVMEDNKSDVTSLCSSLCSNRPAATGVNIPEVNKPLSPQQPQPNRPGVSAPGTSDPNQATTEPPEKSTLVDYLAENMQAIVDGEMFAVIPLTWCPHLDSLFVIPPNVRFEQGKKCINCEHTVENWVCLHCYVTACGRSINGHMQDHCHASGHSLVLSLLDLSVWCNICDSYVDNPLLYDAKNNAHMCKFGVEMPWCYHTDTDTVQMH